MPHARTRIATVRDHMSEHVIEVEPHTSLRRAIEAMRSKRIHHLCVMDGANLLGILSDRDIARALPSPLVDFDWGDYDTALDSITARQTMTRAPTTVKPDTPMGEAARLMLERGIHALPVREGNRVVGVLSETDCIRHYAWLVELPAARTSYPRRPL